MTGDARSSDGDRLAGDSRSLGPHTPHLDFQSLYRQHDQSKPNTKLRDLWEAFALKSQSITCMEQGEYKQAEKHQTRALAIQEKHLEPECMELVSTLQSLSNIYLAQGKAKEAEGLQTRALAIQEKHWRRECMDLIPTLQGLASTYRMQGKYEKAEESLAHYLAYQRSDAVLSHGRGYDRL